MSSKNDITGDRLVSRALSEEGRSNWDKIFGIRKPKPPAYIECEVCSGLQIVRIGDKPDDVIICPSCEGTGKVVLP